MELRLKDLADKQLSNIIKVKLNQPVNPLNFKALYFNGQANGSNLTRVYNNTDLIGNYVRIISVQFAFYADNSIWTRETVEDNLLFTNNGNTRYSTVRPYTRIDSFWLEKMVIGNQLIVSVDSNSLNIFPSTYFPAFDKLDLNILPQNQIVDGIDLSMNLTFYQDMEGNTTNNPYVTALMFVELLNDIKPLEITNQ